MPPSPAEILDSVSSHHDPGERVEAISAFFVGVPYREHTLAPPEGPEVLVTDLGQVDCFTLLDYVEALRLSLAAADFHKRLIHTRYRSGTVSFVTRNHFFTDWKDYRSNAVQDVTALIGRGAEIRVRKVLNLRADGTPYVPGLPPRKRDLVSIPSAAVTPELLLGLYSGDYVGISSPQPGLDVSHVGIAVRAGERILFRHASLRARKVLDEDFLSYASAAHGIMVLRPSGQNGIAEQEMCTHKKTPHRICTREEK